MALHSRATGNLSYTLALTYWVEYTGQIYREGKATPSAELAGIRDRIGRKAESWQGRDEGCLKATESPTRGPGLRPVGAAGI